jgi:cell division protein FtsB
MQGDFYRKPQKRNWFKSVGKGLFKTRRRGIITIVGAILLLYLLFDNKGIIARIRLELQKQEMTEKVRQAEQETKQLQSELKALQGDKQTIEKVAREKHGMVREGETVYRVKKD